MTFSSSHSGTRTPHVNKRLALGRVLLALALAAPHLLRACACGCGIFEVGTASMMPTQAGASAFVNFDYQDQNTNRSGWSTASADDNPDKDIRTSFTTFGVQDMFSRSWGLRVELPYEQRHFSTTGGASGSDAVNLNFSGIGDVRIMGVYTGASEDLSQGIEFGVKLPTGSYTYEDAYGDVDRDSEIGTGSTDLLLGGFKRFAIADDSAWSGFAQTMLDVPLFSKDQYRPGAEFDLAVGAYRGGFQIGGLKVAPVGQVKFSARLRDTGANAADPVASGFERVLLAPGLEFDAHPFKVYADIEVPVIQRYTGDQLAAKVLFHLSVSAMF